MSAPQDEAPETKDRPEAPRIDLITLFPSMVEGFFAESILGRAVKNGLLSLRAHNLRDWAQDKHRKVDDTAFGGGAGMLMAPAPLFAAIESLRRPGTRVVYLCPDGRPLTNALARDLAATPHLVLISGHYEGMDQRVREALVTDEISIGDYVLTNGTIAAAVLVDCLARQIPGVLGDEASLKGESFCESDGLLSHPQYTRPAEFRGMRVPPVLLSGNHRAIDEWNREKRIEKTRERRPDLFAKFEAVEAAKIPQKKARAAKNEPQAP